MTVKFHVSICGYEEVVHVDKEVVRIFCKEVLEDVSHGSVEHGW